MSLMRLPSWAYTLAAVLPAIIAIALPLPNDMATRLAVTIAVLAWVVVLATLAWLRLDEAGKEAHKFAWFWGGAFGLLIAQIVALGALMTPVVAGPVVALVQSYMKNGAATETAFAAGILVAAIIQVVAYGLVWTGWWLSRRMGK